MLFTILILLERVVRPQPIILCQLFSNRKFREYIIPIKLYLDNGWGQGTSYRPTHSSTMTITFPANFGQLLGFSAGTYPTSSPIYLGANSSYSSDTITTENAQPLIILGNSLTSTTYPLNSGSTNFTVTESATSFAPLGSTVNGIVVRCSLVNNPISMPSDILDVMNINVKFGSNIIYLLTIKSELDKNSIWKNG